MNASQRHSVAQRVYRFFAWLIAAGVVAQLLLAGVSIFVDGTRWRLHAMVGHSFSLPLLAMVVIALVGRLPRRFALLALAGIALMMVQGASAALGGWAGVIHPANALLIFGLAHRMLRTAAGDVDTSLHLATRGRRTSTRRYDAEQSLEQ